MILLKKKIREITQSKINYFWCFRNIVLFFIVFLFYVTNVYSQVSLQQLRDEIDNTVKGFDCETSISIVSASKNDVLYQYNPDAKMIPASVTKLITSAAALIKLGLSYNFKTIIFTDDNNINDGVINGNIYLKGYGDPDLSSEDLTQMAEKVAKLNIRKITGNLIYDESFLDDNYYSLSGIYVSDTDPMYWPYVSGLSIDKNKGTKNPAFYAASYLIKELNTLNIEFSGIIVPGSTPESLKVLVKFLRPISEVISNMNKPSDNQSAITVYKVLGAEIKSPPGSLKKGTEVIIDFFNSIGISRDSYEILEGSGLTRYNMVTSGAITKLLKYMYDQIDIFDTFLNSLAIAGVDGTLANRMKNTEAEHNVYAKTGTLNYVSTLAGYAISRDNELMIFYIAMNGFKKDKTAYYRKKQDRFCELICKFSRN
ncbi:MAG: D-alanyl-D-alanine carboxypeptidase/D-alanyl-D-alanine-endopeptidase [Ignavibacteria bacterium]|nr:D-alanyl-D-alanine carboxypeptidase/D-alanyl-D-alanine-endopeptidase [Ignavibacteria bacterium]